jgi:hypothetical protein
VEEEYNNIKETINISNKYGSVNCLETMTEPNIICPRRRGFK